MQIIVRFFYDERGATAIEYSTIALLIGMIILIAVKGIGKNLNNNLTNVNNGMAR